MAAHMFSRFCSQKIAVKLLYGLQNSRRFQSLHLEKMQISAAYHRGSSRDTLYDDSEFGPQVIPRCQDTTTLNSVSEHFSMTFTCRVGTTDSINTHNRLSNRVKSDLLVRSDSWWPIWCNYSLASRNRHLQSYSFGKHPCWHDPLLEPLSYSLLVSTTGSNWLYGYTLLAEDYETLRNHINNQHVWLSHARRTPGPPWCHLPATMVCPAYLEKFPKCNLTKDTKRYKKRIENDE